MTYRKYSSELEIIISFYDKIIAKSYDCVVLSIQSPLSHGSFSLSFAFVFGFFFNFNFAFALVVKLKVLWSGSGTVESALEN